MSDPAAIRPSPPPIPPAALQPGSTACDRCGATIRHWVSQTCRCPRCGRVVVVPPACFAPCRDCLGTGVVPDAGDHTGPALTRCAACGGAGRRTPPPAPPAPAP